MIYEFIKMLDILLYFFVNVAEKSFFEEGEVNHISWSGKPRLTSADQQLLR
jgi:hypothetical protein